MNLQSLQLSYLLLSLVATLVLLFLGSYAIGKTVEDPKNALRKKLILLLGFVVWHTYIFVLASTDVLLNFDFPPRFALLLIIPLFLFTGIFIYKNRDKKWITVFPTHWLILFQSFRVLVEAIFVASVANGILNKEVTIEGFNYDMVFAYTAIVVGILAFKKLASKRLLLLWNYLGLAVIASIIFLFMASIFAPQIFGSETMLTPPEAVRYPYVLVAGYLMPVAVFMHVLTIAHLRKKG